MRKVITLRKQGYMVTDVNGRNYAYKKDASGEKVYKLPTFKEIGKEHADYDIVMSRFTMLKLIEN